MPPPVENMDMLDMRPRYLRNVQREINLRIHDCRMYFILILLIESWY